MPRGRPKKISVEATPVQEQQRKPEQDNPNQIPIAQKTQEQTFWEDAAKKGFANFFVVAKAEDLSNPDQDYITIGWKDPNGLPIPAITATKEAWVNTAKLILAKYDMQ